ncbi:uncharacterized protein LOC134465519 [Engraulis encrasicolus]|uniref:uncharacterized protein LOC134465519 n=1 Tax=Engraulis encrasicolus TaxID=184585 RepID=UPI002FD1EED8
MELSDKDFSSLKSSERQRLPHPHLIWQTETEAGAEPRRLDACDVSVSPDQIVPSIIEVVDIPIMAAPESITPVPDLLEHMSNDTQGDSMQTDNETDQSTVLEVELDGSQYQTSQRQLKTEDVIKPEKESVLRHEETTGSQYGGAFATFENNGSPPEKHADYPLCLQTEDICLPPNTEDSSAETAITSCDFLLLRNQTCFEEHRVTPDLIQLPHASVAPHEEGLSMSSSTEPPAMQKTQEPKAEDEFLFLSAINVIIPKSPEECEEAGEEKLSQTYSTELVASEESELTSDRGILLENLQALIPTESDVSDDTEMIPPGQTHSDPGQDHLGIVNTAEASSESIFDLTASYVSLDETPHTPETIISSGCLVEEFESQVTDFTLKQTDPSFSDNLVNPSLLFNNKKDTNPTAIKSDVSDDTEMIPPGQTYSDPGQDHLVITDKAEASSDSISDLSVSYLLYSVTDASPTDYSVDVTDASPTDYSVDVEGECLCQTSLDMQYFRCQISCGATQCSPDSTNIFQDVSLDETPQTPDTIISSGCLVEEFEAQVTALTLTQTDPSFSHNSVNPPLLYDNKKDPTEISDSQQRVSAPGDVHSQDIDESDIELPAHECPDLQKSLIPPECDVIDYKGVIPLLQAHLHLSKDQVDMVEIAEACCETISGHDTSQQTHSVTDVSHTDCSVDVEREYSSQAPLDVQYSQISCETSQCTDNANVCSSDDIPQTTDAARTGCLNFEVQVTDLTVKQDNPAVSDNLASNIEFTYDNESVTNPTEIPESQHLVSTAGAVPSQEKDESDLKKTAHGCSHPIFDYIPLALSQKEQLSVPSENYSLAPDISIEAGTFELTKSEDHKPHFVCTEQPLTLKKGAESLLADAPTTDEQPVSLCAWHDCNDGATDAKPTAQFHEDSDPEMYFDCKQTISDHSEAEPEDIDKKSTFSRSDAFPGVKMRPRSSRNPRHCVLQRQHRRSMLSSGSEDYEDAVFTQGHTDTAPKTRGPTMASPLGTAQAYGPSPRVVPPPRRWAQCMGEDVSLKREVENELGVLSDSSEEDVLTTRVVRRRVIIQGDESPDLASQTTSEERYVDEDGNEVVKKVTRKIIKRCISDGVEREEVMGEGSSQEPVSVGEGDGYSKVVKRTVLRSEGHQTEVTFCEKPGATGVVEQEQREGPEVHQVVETSQVQGERMEVHHGDTTLASDLPSAKDDFSEALRYLGFSKKSPQIVEQQIVKEDGSVIRRTRMNRAHTQRRTQVKDAQGRRNVIVERLDGRAQSPCLHSHPGSVQRHFHHLIHQYCAESKRPKDDEEEEEEE